MKKRNLICLALVTVFLLIAVTACDSAPEAPSTDYIYFENTTGVRVLAFYISDPESEEWGDKLNYGDYVSVGAKIHIDAAKLFHGPGLYDVGVLDENGLLYEAYEVELTPGDSVSMTADGEDAVCVVTHMDGSQSEWYGYAYYADEEAEG